MNHQEGVLCHHFLQVKDLYHWVHHLNFCSSHHFPRSSHLCIHICHSYHNHLPNECQSPLCILLQAFHNHLHYSLVCVFAGQLDPSNRDGMGMYLLLHISSCPQNRNGHCICHVNRTAIVRLRHSKDQRVSDHPLQFREYRHFWLWRRMIVLRPSLTNYSCIDLNPCRLQEHQF